MKNWGFAALLAVATAGCAARPPAPALYEAPPDGKAMVDRLRVERPSYRPMQNGVAPLSIFIEAPPTYYPPLCWGYRPVTWSDCGYRPSRWRDCGPRYGRPYLFLKPDCRYGF